MLLTIFLAHRLWCSQISSGFVSFCLKRIEKDLALARIRTWVQFIRSWLCLHYSTATYWSNCQIKLYKTSTQNVCYINRSWLRFPNFWACFDLWGLLHDFLIIRIYDKALNVRFQKKKSSLAWERTYENVTRPEEIYEDQSLSVLPQ